MGSGDAGDAALAAATRRTRADLTGGLGTVPIDPTPAIMLQCRIVDQAAIFNQYLCSATWERYRART
jgi:hypothetical protein